MLPALQSKTVELLSSVQQYTLPPIPCSLPVKCHPDFAYLSRVADTWAMKAMELDKHKNPAAIAKVVQSRIPLAFCFIVPEGIGEAEMIASCKYIWSTSFIDDPFDEETEVERAIKWKDVVLGAATGNMKVNNSSSIKAYAELMADFRKTMPPPMFSRFLNCHYTWADQCVELVRRKQFKSPPKTVEEYLAGRCENLLMEAIYILGEFCMRVQLDEEFLASPEFKQIWTVMLEHVAMVNDVISIKVDILNRHFYTVPGLIFLLDPDIQNFQQAVVRSCDLEALPFFISGNLYWHYLSARYHGVDNPLVTGEPFHGTISMEPSQPAALALQLNRHPFLLDIDNLKKSHAVDDPSTEMYNKNRSRLAAHSAPAAAGRSSSCRI